MLDISGWEFLTLGVIAVIIFGPDKLPKFAADAGRLLNQIRGYVNGAKDELTKELGPEFADVKVSDLTPRGMMRKALGEDNTFDELKQSIDVRQQVEQFRDLRNPLQFGAPGAIGANGKNGSANGRHVESEPDAVPADKVPDVPEIKLSRPAAAAAPAPAAALSNGEAPPFDLDAT